MKSAFAFAILLAAASGAARADEALPEPVPAPRAEASAPSPVLRPAAGRRHAHMRAYRAYHGRYALHAGSLPGVLGMDLGGPVYWRPGVPTLPDVVYDIVESDVVERGAVVRARY